MIIMDVMMAKDGHIDGDDDNDIMVLMLKVIGG